ncbi:MAG: hypothetical protein J2P36_20795 [Ktedonobacteraceae bacterium]|nr:hypothetical protein [Ktedonobacteraceae bacterium]
MIAVVEKLERQNKRLAHAQFAENVPLVLGKPGSGAAENRHSRPQRPDSTPAGRDRCWPAWDQAGPTLAKEFFWNGIRLQERTGL